MRILYVLIFVLYVFLLLSPNSFAVEVEQYEIPAGGIQTVVFNLETDEAVQFSISVTGGNNDINLWVTDPSGQLDIPKQGVIGGISGFQFIADRAGAHTIHFDNSFSLLTPKIVTLTYEVKRYSSDSSGGGCLIATATYGSELAPQVQQLREIRDNTLLQTNSGSAFMTVFNQFYYSFSPTIADMERENPVFKETVKLAITPLITSLSILNYVDIDSEAEVLGYGISLILLNVGMYFVLPAIVIHRVRKLV